MDNITHSIAGALTAEAALQWAPARVRPECRGALHLAAVLANNLPDLDFVYTAITEGKLGYLLHHRGHTHTVFVGVAMALLLSLAFAIWLRRAEPVRWRLESAWVASLALVGVLLHLGLDFGNNYGIHPWWPWNNQWYYGDRVFIVEPLWLVSGLSSLFFLVQSKLMRALTALGWLLSLGVVWLVPLPGIVRASVTLVALVAVAVGFAVSSRPLFSQRKLGRGLILSVALGVWLVVYSIQIATHAMVSSRLAGHHGLGQHFQIVDIVKTPIPSMPWCWDIVALGTEADDYVVRLGRFSLWPAQTPARGCPIVRQEATAPAKSIGRDFAQAIEPGAGVWDKEYRLPLKELQGLYAGNCWFRAFARFSRAPFVTGEAPIVGDFRYDREAALEFAEMELPNTESCPEFVPPWQPPRRGLLEPR